MKGIDNGSFYSAIPGGCLNGKGMNRRNMRNPMQTAQQAAIEGCLGLMGMHQIGAKPSDCPHKASAFCRSDSPREPFHYLDFDTYRL